MFIHLSHIVFSFYQIWCISAHPNVQFICTIGWVNIHFVSVDIAAVALTLGPRQIGNKKIPESFKNCSLIRQYHLLSSWQTLRTGILCHTLQIKSQNILIVFQIALWKLLLDEHGGVFEILTSSEAVAPVLALVCPTRVETTSFPKNINIVTSHEEPKSSCKMWRRFTSYSTHTWSLFAIIKTEKTKLTTV